MPFRPAGSPREPARTQMPMATERICGICSATSTRPLGRTSLSMEIPACFITSSNDGTVKAEKLFHVCRASEKLWTFGLGDQCMRPCYYENNRPDFHASRDARRCTYGW